MSNVPKLSPGFLFFCFFLVYVAIFILYRSALSLNLHDFISTMSGTCISLASPKVESQFCLQENSCSWKPFAVLRLLDVISHAGFPPDSQFWHSNGTKYKMIRAMIKCLSMWPMNHIKRLLWWWGRTIIPWSRLRDIVQLSCRAPGFEETWADLLFILLCAMLVDWQLEISFVRKSVSVWVEPIST